MKNQKNKTTTKTKQTTTATKNPKRNTHKTKRKIKKDPPIFPNDFSHVAYLFLNQNLLSTIHLRYLNYVIC